MTLLCFFDTVITVTVNAVDIIAAVGGCHTFDTVITVTVNAVDIIAVVGGCHTFAQKGFTQLHT